MRVEDRIAALKISPATIEILLDVDVYPRIVS
jgi:hypothetical protein